jgi:hypothetical protein
MTVIGGYIGSCRPENSTVDRGVSRDQQWNSRDDYFQCTPPLQALFIIYIECHKVKSYSTNCLFTLSQSLPCNVLYSYAASSIYYKRSNDVV